MKRAVALADIPVLPLELVRRLPGADDCQEYDAGVYFLWLDDNLQYIGMSKQICNRINMHEYAKRVGDSVISGHKTIPFDSYTFLLCERGNAFNVPRAIRERLQTFERAYIAHFQPPFNELGADRRS